MRAMSPPDTSEWPPRATGIAALAAPSVSSRRKGSSISSYRPRSERKRSARLGSQAEVRQDHAAIQEGRVGQFRHRGEEALYAHRRQVEPHQRARLPAIDAPFRLHAALLGEEPHPAGRLALQVLPDTAAAATGHQHLGGARRRTGQDAPIEQTRPAASRPVEPVGEGPTPPTRVRMASSAGESMSNWLATLRGSVWTARPACSASSRARGLSMAGSSMRRRASTGEKATRSAE